MVEPSSPRNPGLRAYFRSVSFLFKRVGQRFGLHARRIVELSSSGQGEYARLKLKVMANLWATGRYAPHPYPGRIDIFLTSSSLSHAHSRRARWGAFAQGGARVHEIPGSHATIVGLHDTLVDKAHMQALAQLLGACIDSSLQFK